MILSRVFFVAKYRWVWTGLILAKAQNLFSTGQCYWAENENGIKYWLYYCAGSYNIWYSCVSSDDTHRSCNLFSNILHGCRRPYGSVHTINSALYYKFWFLMKSCQNLKLGISRRREVAISSRAALQTTICTYVVQWWPIHDTSLMKTPKCLIIQIKLCTINK